MTLAQAQNLMQSLMAANATFQATQDAPGNWTVRATSQSPVSQITLANFVAGITPASPAVLAFVDSALFK